MDVAKAQAKHVSQRKKSLSIRASGGSKAGVGSAPTAESTLLVPGEEADPQAEDVKVLGSRAYRPIGRGDGSELISLPPSI